MAVTYNKLWHLLIDRGMKKKDLKEFRKQAQLIFQNPYTEYIAKGSVEHEYN